ncbi:hypothetical protein Pcinc_040307 [Petrolisthes cinctipes]|uniref:Uncharacterized protein n=1 Tax=Petrolisthes cinctipes TaxID=88211 RepID=A0AAE1EIR3_PETCI|nr:hypothetical protein Pcinc_040307 [Petrolisthes cinctipes]
MFWCCDNLSTDGPIPPGSLQPVRRLPGLMLCPPPSTRRRRRNSSSPPVDPTLPPLLNNLQYNLSSLSLEQFSALPHVTTPEGGRVPLHISVVEQVRKLWDSNPRLLSSVSCTSPTEAVRSSFISLSGVASGIILAYSVAQLNQCYPDHHQHHHQQHHHNTHHHHHRQPDLPPKIWFFPIPKPVPPSTTTTTTTRPPAPVHVTHPHAFAVPVLPMETPVPGEDEAEDGCGRDEVSLGRDSCATLLSSKPCPYRHWVLLNAETKTGECVPRLCADNLVFVEADGLCHDVNEPGMCPGERRLYLTASGTAVCDCPEGSSQRVTLDYTPSGSSQRVTLDYTPSGSSQRVTLDYTPSGSSQRVTLDYTPSGSSQRVTLDYTPSGSSQRVTLDYTPSGSSQRVTLDYTPSGSSQRGLC